jgi:lipoate-protein ligase B
VLASRAELSQRGIRLLDVDRGGEVTYHGPGQIIGFPTGPLEAHTGDSRAVRAFVDGLKSRLSQVVRAHGHEIGPETEGGAGVWVSRGRKIASIGLAFGRDGIRHGFALNVLPMSEFALINPCGARGAPPQASLTDEPGRLGSVIAALVDILSPGR